VICSPAGLTVFDFDNSEYNWFAADLGTAVFEAATCGYQKLPRDEFIKGFLDKFVEGYEREFTLGAIVEQIPLFAKNRCYADCFFQWPLSRCSSSDACGSG
jgi:amicoumacin kinase